MYESLGTGEIVVQCYSARRPEASICGPNRAVNRERKDAPGPGETSCNRYGGRTRAEVGRQAPGGAQPRNTKTQHLAGSGLEHFQEAVPFLQL